MRFDPKELHPLKLLRVAARSLVEASGLRIGGETIGVTISIGAATVRPGDTVETLVERGARGRITKIDWERLLRRWAQDAPLENRGEMASYLELRWIVEC